MYLPLTHDAWYIFLVVMLHLEKAGYERWRWTDIRKPEQADQYIAYMLDLARKEQ